MMTDGQRAMDAVTDAIRIQNELAARTGGLNGMDTEEFARLYHAAVALFCASLNAEAIERTRTR